MQARLSLRGCIAQTTQLLFWWTIYFYCSNLPPTKCYPVLSYHLVCTALECFNFPNTCVHQLNACWNSVHRRIFDFKSWESVRELIRCLNSSTLYLYYQKKLCFLPSMMCCNNTVITSVAGVFIRSLEYSKLCKFAYVSPCNLPNEDKLPRNGP